MNALKGQLIMFPMPPANYTETSQKAAVEILDHALTLRQRVHDYVMRCGEYGATNEEISIQLRMSIQTVCARRNELVRMGLLHITDRRRLTTTGRSAEVVAS